MLHNIKNIEENVSRESLEKLQAYDVLLHKWQKTINLVSPNTLQNSWERHILDSVQVADNVSRESLVLYDLGCGAGFPGLVIAMLRPDINVHLIESDQRKCSFMRAVSRETSTPVTIHNNRIENIDLPAPNIITARALASLKDLLTLCEKWKNSDTTMLFLKGETHEQEIREAQEVYDISVKIIPSALEENSVLLKINWE